MSGAFIRAHDLAVGYGGRVRVRGVELEIARGEVAALIGPNGAGKSTLLRAIARQLAPMSGVVEIDSRDIRSMSGRDLALRLAAVFTERSRPELYMCRDVVAAGRYPHTGALGILSASDRREVARAMETTRTLELADRPFDAISDGQRQRVLLARAICQEPQAIILDEPTSFLDIKHKAELLAMLRGMARERGTAVIMSLHEIDLAQKCADRVICVKDGEIVAAGAPEAVCSDDAIARLYGLDDGWCAYAAVTGSVEMARPSGAPSVFVIAGGGSGAHIFRALQRSGTAFAAGILHENDVDYAVASALASLVVSERPFFPYSDEAIASAREVIASCERVIVSPYPSGPMSAPLDGLVAFARERGVLE